MQKQRKGPGEGPALLTPTHGICCTNLYMPTAVRSRAGPQGFGNASALQRLRQIRLRGTSLLTDAGGIFLIQILEYFLYGYYVAILGVYVVEICLMGVGVAVADSFARHDRSEAILQSVHHRCPDAARGRGTGDDERVYPSSGKKA